MRYLMLFLLLLPVAFALSPYEAAHQGEKFIRENALVGSAGILADYEVRFTAIYQNQIDYRIYY